MNKAVFINKEGTVGLRSDEYQSIGEYQLFQGARESLREIRDLGYQIFFLEAEQSKAGERLLKSLKDDLLIHGVRIHSILLNKSEIQLSVAKHNISMDDSYLITADAEDISLFNEFRGFKAFVLYQHSTDITGNGFCIEGGITEVPDLMRKDCNSRRSANGRNIFRILGTLFG